MSRHRHGKRLAPWELSPLYQLGRRADTSGVHRRFGWRLLCVAIAAIMAGCASTGFTPRPFPVPGGGSAAPGGASAPGRPAPGTKLPDTYALTGTALSLRGSPYRNGGIDPTGFDCSGFTQYVFGQYGIDLPREVRDQFAAGKAVNPTEVMAGDLLFFTTVAPGASHVGISLGGDEFIHAPSSTGVVRVERVSAQYWSQRFVGARRVG